jgi:hypothetical protein
MANFLKDNTGKLFKLMSHKVKGDVIWEIDEIKRISPDEWVEDMNEAISNAGSYYLGALEWLHGYYASKYGDYEMLPITDELKQDCVDWFNELRDGDIENEDDESPWYTDEPFTMDNVEL